MDDMSNTRKEIAARLGLTDNATNAKPGKKATMEQPAQAYANLISEYNALDKRIGRLMDRAKEMSVKSDRILSLFPKDERNPDPAAIAKSRQAMNALRDEINAMLGIFKFDRAGEKSVMGRDEQIAEAERLLQEAKSLMTSNAWGKASTRIMDLQDVLRGVAKRGDKNITTDAKARQLLAEAKAMITQMATGRKFSRPGAKAKMGRMLHSYEVNELEEFLDAYGVKDYDIVSTVGQVKVPKSQVRTALDAIAALNREIRKEGIGGSVSVDVVPFSRLGAKAKMGRVEDLYRKLSSGSVTYANAKEWERLVTEALRLPDFTPAGGDMSLHEIAEDLGGDLMALKTHSGPVMHAKATMSAQQTVAMNVDRAEQAIARGDRDAARRHIKSAQDALDDTVTAAGLRKRLEQLAQRYKMAMDEAPETEDVKAGLKLIAASDEAVSDKIRKLMKEGKPQDQAVAIALDMKRRGEI